MTSIEKIVLALILVVFIVLCFVVSKSVDEFAKCNPTVVTTTTEGKTESSIQCR